MQINNEVLYDIWKDRYSKHGESIDDNLHRVAKYCSTSPKEEDDFFEVMDKGLFFPAGRTMSNSGIGKDLTLGNCFTLNFVEDSLEDIFEKVKIGAITQSKGGGTGYEFSKIRPSGTPTNNDAIASGVCSFMDVFNAQTATILQGNRRGANMGILSIYHPDIFQYLDAKSFDEGRLVHFNLSIMVDDAFMKAKQNNETITLHFPIYNEKGQMITDSSKWTHTSKVDANELWDRIMQKAYTTGEYGVFFYENINKDNNTWYMETIVNTNPCFTGDMKLLTDKGYIEIGTLDGQQVNIVNKDGHITEGKVWCSGIKEIIKLEFDNGITIKCTPNHIFMLSDGGKCEAKDLLLKTINRYESKEVTKVVRITLLEKERVYDFNEPVTHWGVIEGFVVHNCGEYLSGMLYGENPSTKEEINSEEYKGACNLGSLFLHNFIINPFTKDVKLDVENLKKAIKLGVSFLDNIIDINKYPHPHYENYQKNMRVIGEGVTGLANAIAMHGFKYGSPEAVTFTDYMMNLIVKESYKASIELAKEKGSFPFLDREKFVKSGFIQKHIAIDPEWKQIADDILKYGIRNARIMSIAPVGTGSLTWGNNCSSSIEPVFSLGYDRKVKMGGQDDKDIKIVKMEDYGYALYQELKKGEFANTITVNEDVFVTAMNLPVEAHLEMLKVLAFHTDMSISKTINIPTEYPFDDMKKVYDYCWENGIKGCTVFRPNPIRQGILISSTTEETPEPSKLEELNRGEWKQKAEDTVYIEKKLYIGCGKLKLFIGWSDSEQCIQDLYIKRSGQGGCLHNLESTVISMSGMLRLGGNLDNIKKAFKGIGGCNSFVSARLKGEKISKGSSCGTAILNCLDEFMLTKQTNSRPSVVKPQTPTKKTTNDNVKTNEEKQFLEKYGEIAFAKHYNKCPMCGENLDNSGGCLTCTQGCGWTKCE